MSQARAKLFFIFSLVVMFTVSAMVVYNSYQKESFEGEEIERVVQKVEHTERAEDQKMSGNTRSLKQATLSVTPSSGLRFYSKPRTTPRGFDLTAEILGFVLLCFMVLLIASCSC